MHHHIRKNEYPNSTTVLLFYLSIFLILFGLSFKAYPANWEKAYFRGTPNGWSSTEMQLNTQTQLWETTQTFTDTSPRFKISRFKNWNEAYPDQDYLINNGPGDYKITFNDETKNITDKKIILAPTPVKASAICIDNTLGFNTPYIYFWDPTPSGTVTLPEWPGLAMSKNGDFYCYDPNQTLTSLKVIFSNNGDKQTPNLTFNGLGCYSNNQWLSLQDCGLAIESTETTPQANAGEDRTANVNTRQVLSAAASEGQYTSATWTSPAWNGTLSGRSIVTPSLNISGTYPVTLTLTNGNNSSSDELVLSVVTPSHGLPERPLLAEPLKFPTTGNVSNGDYTFVKAFPNLDGKFLASVMVLADGNNDLIYVVDKPGIVYVFPNTESVTQQDVVTLLDISEVVKNYHEQGLLGMAFDPDYENNGYFYLYYIAGTTDTEKEGDGYGDAVLERWAVNNPSAPTAVVNNSNIEILRIPQPGPDHKGGMMQFHPTDGFLYVGIGDGAYAYSAITPFPNNDPRTNNNAQDTSNLLGSMIRIKPLNTPVNGRYYSIPTDNPFIGNSAIRDEIWSYGHRNPWRWAFDQQSPYTLWQTEVGQQGYEEVNIILKGRNYGWPVCEGTVNRGELGGDPQKNCSSDFEAPIEGYNHTGASSIIGGFLYRGNQLPALFGHFIFGDYNSKKIWSASSGQEKSLLSDAFPENIASFGTNRDGNELFISTYGIEFGDGSSSIYKVVDLDAEPTHIPEILSNTGLFVDLTSLIPANGVIEYNINSNAWFDGAISRHFISIPNDKKINFDSKDQWNLPVGSVLVKHQEIPIDAQGNTTPLTTSVLFRQDSGWQAVNYQWNADKTDADRVTEISTQIIKQYDNGALVDRERNILSPSECGSCHVGNGSKNPLSINTRQLNLEFNYQGFSENQLDALNFVTLFDEVILNHGDYEQFVNPENTSANIELRARSYLHNNCAHCHSSTVMDLSYDTPLQDMKIVNVETTGNQYRLKPFDSSSSLIHIYQTSDSNRMPKGTKYTNPVALELFKKWIDAADAVKTDISITTDNKKIKVGSSTNLTANAVFNNGFITDITDPVSWSTSDTSVLSVEPSTNATIEITGGAAGTAIVSATASGFSTNIEITVESGPIPPSNFTAQAISSSAVTLNWQDNSHDETLFYVLRSTNPGGTFEEVATLPANSTTYTDSGLTANTQYFYKLQAINDDGVSLPIQTAVTTDNIILFDILELYPSNTSIFTNSSQQVFAIASKANMRKGVSYDVTWSSNNENVATVSTSGLITGGNTAGSVVISATLGNLSSTITIVNRGVGKYLYFKKPVNWEKVHIWAWTNINGVIKNQTGDQWPGLMMEPALEYGDTWYRFPITEDMYDGGNHINVIFNCGNNSCKTDDLEAPKEDGNWFADNAWLTQPPIGKGTPLGTQVQVGNGTVALSQSTDNLSEKLFTPSTIVDIKAEIPGPGQKFVGWEGSGIAVLLNAKSPNTKLYVEDKISITLLAVYETIMDTHEVARQEYLSKCLSCHGNTGTGNGEENTSLENVINKYSLAALSEYIRDNMPKDNTSHCDQECAARIAAMIYDNAYLPPENLCDANSLDDLIPQDRNYRLLTRLEYNNTIRDLLGLQEDIDITTDKVPPSLVVNGFKTDANTEFTHDHSKGYILSAEAAADKVNSLYQLEPSCNTVSCFITTFGKKAFRRPLSATETSQLLSLHASQGDRGLLVGIFSSPSLLYRSELGTKISSGEATGYYRLSAYEVASLLSYTYWATTPDAQLMTAADEGKLSNPEQIKQQVVRLLSDPKAQLAFERFIEGWLNLDKPIYANIDDSLKSDLKQETFRFVKSIVFNNGYYEELLNANYSYMTKAIADHYRLPWPGGSGWQKITYSGDSSDRRGVLGHASILAAQSTSESTHPIKRGLFVRRNLLCQKFPPPPLGADLSPVIDPSHTVRERFESHLQESCATCHQYIDGIGFGLESYDHLGLFRTTEITGDNTVRTVDSSGNINSLNSAETFLSETGATHNFDQLSELSNLISESSNGKACYARQWYRYTRGQLEEKQDSCTLETIGKTFKGEQGSTLLELMVKMSQTKNYILRK